MQATRTSLLDERPALAELVDRAALGELCRSWADLYGLGVKIFDARGRRIVDLKVGNGDFCAAVFATPTGRRRCTATVAAVKERGNTSAPAGELHACFTGLAYLVLPLLHEGDRIGKLILGPFRPDALTELPPGLADLGPGFDPAVAARHLTRIRQAPEAVMRQVLAHLRLEVDLLVEAGYRAHLTSAAHLESMTESWVELKARNAELTEALAKREELDRAKSNFLATVSHELRTPLTSVIGYSEMLLEDLAGPLSPAQRGYVNTIMEKGEHLLQIITSLLDLSRVEADRVRLDLAEAAPEPLIQAALSTLHPQARKKGVQVSCRIEENLPRVTLDAGRVRQCVVNLLGNAIKFTPPQGEVAVEVFRWRGPRHGVADLRFESQDADYLRVDVRDTGIGIPPDQLEQVFDSFYQVDDSATRSHGGTGLGLSIVRAFVEAHGGRVSVESRVGEGSTFSLVLPLEGPSGLLPPPADPGP